MCGCDSDSACFADCCGICAIFGITSLGTWCNLKPFGSDGCCGRNSHGCCGSCCADSFNEDSFDKQVKKDKTRIRAPDTDLVVAQPKAGNDMAVNQ